MNDICFNNEYINYILLVNFKNKIMKENYIFTKYKCNL